MSESVGSAFPGEMARVQEVLDSYRAIGPAGAFAAAWIQDTITRADAAWKSGDVLRIISAFQELREVKE